jgi:hypothetical protein
MHQMHQRVIDARRSWGFVAIAEETSGDVVV